MKKAFADLQPQGLEVVGVTTYYGYYKNESNTTRDMPRDTEFERMKTFVAEHELPWPVVFGERSNFDKYGVGGIPHITVIDRDGKVHSFKIGYSPASFAEFRKELEGLLKK